MEAGCEPSASAARGDLGIGGVAACTPSPLKLLRQRSEGVGQFRGSRGVIGQQLRESCLHRVGFLLPFTTSIESLRRDRPVPSVRCPVGAWHRWPSPERRRGVASTWPTMARLTPEEAIHDPTVRRRSWSVTSTHPARSRTRRQFFAMFTRCVPFTWPANTCGLPDRRGSPSRIPAAGRKWHDVRLPLLRSRNRPGAALQVDVLPLRPQELVLPEPGQQVEHQRGANVDVRLLVMFSNSFGISAGVTNRVLDCSLNRLIPPWPRYLRRVLGPFGEVAPFDRPS